MLLVACRRRNEVDGIHKRGGVVIEVKGKNDRPMYYSEEWERYFYSDEQGGQVHQSEEPLNVVFDFTIDNMIHDDDFANLDKQLEAIGRSLNLPMKLREEV